MHYIQKHILKVLAYAKYARFSEMRPPRVDSNAYSYHLKTMQRDAFVEKTDRGYRLSPKGLAYVDKVSLDDFEQRLQPKIMTLLVIKNAAGQILLHEKRRQPFIGSKLLPSGKIHLEDTSLLAAAQRELREKVGSAADGKLNHAGDVYIRSRIAGELVSSIAGHVFTGRLVGDEPLLDGNSWVRRDALTGYKLAPATADILADVETSGGFFFREYDIEW